jgi:VWFA-related protein
MISRLIRFSSLLVLVSAVLMTAAVSGDKDKKEQAKDQDQQSFKISTHLVLVPVIVTDKHGDHVTGLSAADFEVKEDGNAQKIVRLDEFTADTAKVVPQPPADNQTFSNQVAADHPKKLAIIALDQVNTPFASAKDGARQLVDFFSKNIDASTLLALVAMRHNGVQIIHNFTSDPAILQAAVRKVQWELSSRDTRTADNLGDNAEADLEARQINDILNTVDVGSALTGGSANSGGGTNAAAAAARAQSRQQRAQVDASFQAQEALITLEDFQQLAEYYGGVPGRKSLIWASTGFPFALGTYPQSTTRGTLFSDWERTFRMLSDANISVYPVDIGGLLPGVGANTLQTINTNALRINNSNEGGVAARSGQMEDVRSGAFLDPVVARQETMRQLAEMTGGQAYYNSNDGAGLFRRAADDSGQYYLLAYYTKDTGKPGWRKLNVKVERDGVKVRARSGFFFSNAATESDAARQSEEIMAMTSDLSFSTLPIQGQWDKPQPAGDKRKVRFLLSVPPGVPFIDADNQNQLNFDFRVVATDANGKVAATIGQRLQTNLPADEAEKIRKAGLDYANELTLAPGQYKVHFVIRDNLKGALGSIVTTLKVE